MPRPDLSDFRRQLAVLVLEAARGVVSGEDVERLNRELAKRWAQRIVAARNGRRTRNGETI